MTHRAEAITAAALVAVTGLVTTGANTDRGRAETLVPDEVPALLVWHGDDEVLETLSHDVLVCALDLRLDILVAEIATNVETACNAIRAEVTVALAADHTLGLAFVEGLVEQGAEQPRIEDGDDTDRPRAMMRLRWRATYMRSRTDPSTGP